MPTVGLKPKMAIFTLATDYVLEPIEIMVLIT